MQVDSTSRKLIFPINVSVDGFADHTSFAPDDELMDFFTDQLENTDVVLFGRETYNLMADYWPHAHENPQASKAELRFAKRYNEMEKVVFSRTLPRAEWNNSRLVRDDMVAEVRKLKQQSGKPVSIGGIAIAQELMRHGLVDEYYLVVHPVAVMKGRRLFDHLDGAVNFRLADTKVFESSAVALHYLAVK
jgi:dihydrofolate reductase